MDPMFCKPAVQLAKEQSGKANSLNQSLDTITISLDNPVS
jgi:hypothetical protein